MTNSTTPKSAEITVDEYLTERKMSRLPVILIEGKEDNLFFQLIKDELLKVSKGKQTDKILSDINFDEIIRIACGISLVAYNIKQIKKVPHYLDDSMLSFEDNSIKLDFNKWDNFLKKKMKLDNNRCNQLLTEIEQCMKIISKFDFQLLRWLCHGHISLKFIWYAFEACVISVGKKYNVTNPHKLLSSIREHRRFAIFASNWINHQLNVVKSCKDTPIECFELLTGTKLIKTDLQV